MFYQRESVVNFVRSDHHERLKILSLLESRIEKQNGIYLGVESWISNYGLNNDVIKTLTILPGLYVKIKSFEIFANAGIWTSSYFCQINAIQKDEYENINIGCPKLNTAILYQKQFKPDVLLLAGIGVKVVDGILLEFNQGSFDSINEFVKYQPFLLLGMKLAKKDMDFEVGITMSPFHGTKKEQSTISIGSFNLFLKIKTKIYSMT